MDTMHWVALAVGAAIILTAGCLLWARLRAASAAGTVFHFRCPSCHARIRYTAQRVGSRGHCPHCNKGLVFPPGDSTAGTGPRK
jgi:hypothetical protein